MDDADFSGYATKAGLKCSDGRTITAEAFKEMDGMQVPLVWQHGHNDPKNVLGYAILEARGDGMYCHGFFNDTEAGVNSKKLVKHGDVKALSIYANSLVEKAKRVLHGSIREVSLVIAGANPGAFIDNVRIAHSSDPSDIEVLDGEAFISTGLPLEHGVDEVSDIEKEVNAIAAETPDETLEHAEGDEKTVQEVYDSFTPEQKQVVHMMVEAAVVADPDEVEDKALAQSATDTDSTTGTTGTTVTKDNEGDLTHQEGSTEMTRNVFDQNDAPSGGNVLQHSDIQSILANAKKGGSFKEALLQHLAGSDELKHMVTDSGELLHSVTNLELLFPDAQAITDSPQFISRRMEWVAKVLDGVRKTPFAKVKTILADITADEARAKGYVKGNQKVEEVLVLLRRTTGPTTIYKLQKLDRDDVVDITDINIVLWLKAEMRLMIEEELARAILVGDGRSTVSVDKVKDPAGSADGNGIRSVLNDSDLYAIKYDLAANVSSKDAVKGLVRARSKFRGSGKPTLFISDGFLTDIMLEEDKFGRALYETEQSLVDKLRVKEIVPIDLLDQHPGLFCIMVSLVDYTIGTNRGGELTSFEDFDLNFNKYEYLQETRLSGGLTKPFSAVVVRRAEGTLAAATSPSFNGETNTITIPTVTGVVYTINDEVATGDVVITDPTVVEASPADGYYLAYNTTREWTYTP